MNPDFDYSTILIKIDQLSRQIYQNILNRNFEDNKPLIEEMLFQNRQLQLWNKNAQSTQQ